MNTKIIKLTKEQILELYQSLINVGNLKGVQFAYAVAKNLNILEPEIEAIRKANNPSDRYIEYDRKRIKLAESHSVKVNGKPEKTIRNGVEAYNVKDEAKFLEELKVIQSEYEKDIVDREKQSKEINELLKESVEVTIYTVNVQHIPTDIEAKQMSDIFLMVDEDKKVVN